MKLRALLLLMLPAVFILSCCKDNDGPTQKDLGHFSLDTLKPYLYFKPGSWWVYRNDSTGQRDSIEMFFCYDVVNTAEGRSRKYTYDNISSFRHSHTNDYDYKMNSYGSNPDMVSWSFYLMWEQSRSKAGDFEGPTEIFTTVLTPGQKFGAASEYVKKIPLYILEGKMYYDVLVFKVNGDPTWPDSFIPTIDHGVSLYYWAKNVGLIRIENSDRDLRKNPPVAITQSWNLIKYNIIP